MTISCQSTNVIQSILDPDSVKDALIRLGWEPGRWTNEMLMAYDCHEYSAFVRWQEGKSQTIVSVRVLNTGRIDKESAGCERRLHEILVALSEIS
jgi:hypothetical protein